MSTKSRRLVLFGVLCAAAGITYLVIGLVRHDATLTIAGPLIMVTYAAVLLVLGRRSEPLALLSGGPGDERQAQVMQRATAATGQVLVAVLVVGALWSLAAGAQNALTFCWLCAVGGVSFVAFTAWFARRG